MREAIRDIDRLGHIDVALEGGVLNCTTWVVKQ